MMNYYHFCMIIPRNATIVRLIGLEPTRPEPPDPKSGASTNSATSALGLPRIT